MEMPIYSPDQSQTKDIPPSPLLRQFLKNLAITGTAILLPGAIQIGKAFAAGGFVESEYERSKRENRQTPSSYKAHVFRWASHVPDISLERIRLIGVTFWPKGETPKQSEVQAPLERTHTRVARFWEKALLDRTNIRSEVLPNVFTGQKGANEYIFPEVIKELRTSMAQQVEDRELKGKLLALLDNYDSPLYVPSSSEFLSLAVTIMHGENGKYYRFGGSGRKGVSYATATMKDVMAEAYIANYIAHELGHGFELPDQYPFYPPSLPNEWEDADPLNIMGSNIFNNPLEGLHLAASTRVWMLNHRNRQNIALAQR